MTTHYRVYQAILSTSRYPPGRAILHNISLGSALLESKERFTTRRFVKYSDTLVCVMSPRCLNTLRNGEYMPPTHQARILVSSRHNFSLGTPNLVIEYILKTSMMIWKSKSSITTALHYPTPPMQIRGIRNNITRRLEQSSHSHSPSLPPHFSLQPHSSPQA